MTQSVHIPAEARPGPRPDGPGEDSITVSRGLRELLLTFQALLEAVNGMPLALLVRSKCRRPGIASRFSTLPRPRWFLRYFMIIHIHSVLGAMDRRYSSRVALGLASQSDSQDRRAIQEFRQSLPSVRTKALVTALLVLTILLSQPLLETAAGTLSALIDGAHAVSDVSSEVSSDVPTPAARPALVAVTPETRKLLEKLKGDASSNLSADSIADALTAVTRARLRDLLLVLVGLVLALYVILRPIMSGFRLKRMMFNLYPDFNRYRTRVPARWSAQRSSGVYRLEADVFKELGAPPAREIPLDLIVSAVGVLLVLWVVVASLSDLSLLTPYAALLLAFVGVRAHWLLTTWRQRSAMNDRGPASFSVRIRGSIAKAEVKSPLTTWLLAVFVTYFSLLPQLGAIGWYRVNRELRDLGYARGTDQLGHFPLLSGLAFLMGASITYAGLVLLAIYAFIPDWVTAVSVYLLAVSWVIFSASVYGTHRRMKRALQISGRGGRRRFLRSLAFGSAVTLAPILISYVGPFYFGYLQAQLNKVWRTEGEPMVAPSQF